MNTFWFILSVFLSFVVGFVSCLVVNWLVRIEAYRITQKTNSVKAVEQKALLKDEKAALILELGSVLKDESLTDQKQKIAAVVNVIVQHPEAAEQLIGKLKKFL